MFRIVSNEFEFQKKPLEVAEQYHPANAVLVRIDREVDVNSLQTKIAPVTLSQTRFRVLSFCIPTIHHYQNSLIVNRSPRSTHTTLITLFRL